MGAGGVPAGQAGGMVGLNTVGLTAGPGSVNMVGSGAAPGSAQVGPTMVMGMTASQVCGGLNC
jgi:hypothetical protein